jgi:tripartite-type tricarboxylate transporter receptor subunit TctC
VRHGIATAPLPRPRDDGFGRFALRLQQWSGLNAAITAGVNTAEVKDALNKLGIEVQTGTPEQFAALIRKDIDVNTSIIKAAGIKPE